MTRQTPDVQLAKTRVDFTFTVVGAEPETPSYRSTPFLPQSVTVTIVNGKVVGSIRVEGPNAKKDGTAGQNWHEGTYSLDYGDSPEWLPLVVAQARQRWADMDNAARVAAEGN